MPKNEKQFVLKLFSHQWIVQPPVKRAPDGKHIESKWRVCNLSQEPNFLGNFRQFSAIFLKSFWVSKLFWELVGEKNVFRLCSGSFQAHFPLKPQLKPRTWNVKWNLLQFRFFFPRCFIADFHIWSHCTAKIQRFFLIYLLPLKREFVLCLPTHSLLPANSSQLEDFLWKFLPGFQHFFKWHFHVHLSGNCYHWNHDYLHTPNPLMQFCFEKQPTLIKTLVLCTPMFWKKIWKNNGLKWP